ncbi:MAG: outer membrane beta-barrel protein [Saprospiraceae bacterium]
MAPQPAWPQQVSAGPVTSAQTLQALPGQNSDWWEVSLSNWMFPKGGKLVSNVTNAVDGDTRYESTITLNYAELPILFRIYTPAKPIQFFAGAGLGASFGLFGRDEIAIHYEKDGVGPVTDIAFRNVDYRDVYKRWDFAAVIEAGFKREAGQGVFSLGLRWTRGLMGIINQTGSQTSEIDQLMNKSLAMTMGYRIYLF